MDKEKLNKNKENNHNSVDNIKKQENRRFSKSKKFPETYINQSNLAFFRKLTKDFNKTNNDKRQNKKEFSHLHLYPRNHRHISVHKSHQNVRKFSDNILLNGFTLHDALYLGMDLRNNKEIRANDVNCYLSSTSTHAQKETNYKVIEKNIQNKILDISMEIFENKKSVIESNITNKSFKKEKSSKKKSSKKLMLKLTSFKERNRTKSITKNRTSQKSLSIKSHDGSTFMIFKEMQNEKIRKISKKNVLYDSMAEDESDENIEEDGNGLNPESLFIDIFDCLLLISSFFCLFYMPYCLAKNKLNIENNDYAILSMIHFSEIIYLLDLIFGFFRWYYNNELKYVKNNYMIFKNYLFGNFLMDLIEAIPFFTILKYIYLNKEDNFQHVILFNENHLVIKIFTCFKALKIFKINDRKNNRAIQYLNKKFSDNYLSERIYQISNFALETISVLHIFICFHIYIGKSSYPNWILASKLQDKSFINIYLASLYFITATMTSVGYGDIVCINKEETCFQILLLSIGIVAYSWIISTVSDYVKNESRASIKYNKDMTQLEEIRISYPNMPFKLYNKIYQHLQRLLKQQEKYDSNILINSLPYKLKTSLIFEIHKEVIKRFIFFNGCENSDFILKVITHFIPLNSKKNAFVIKEGDIIESIFFVKEGRLALEAAIDLDNIEESVERYLEYQFNDISSLIESKVEDTLSNILKEKKEGDKSNIIKNYKELFNIVSKQTQLIGDLSYMHESHIEEEIGKCDLNGENEEVELRNLQFLHIIDILKNEHFGEVYMFLNKPSPLSLRVKSKRVDLFLLRKKDAINIKKDYPNIWKRINDKSTHNMKSIKNLTKKVIKGYCKMNGIIQDKEILERSDHLFGCNDNSESNENNNKESNNDNYSKKKRMSKSDKKKNSLINNSRYSLNNNRLFNNGFNSMSSKKRTRTSEAYDIPFLKKKNSNYGWTSPRRKKPNKKSILRKKTLDLKNEIIKEEEQLFEVKKKPTKNRRSLKLRNKDELYKQISKHSSISMNQSDNSINDKINKKDDNNNELKLQNNLKEVKINSCDNRDNNKNNENVLKFPETIENCHLSNIPRNSKNLSGLFFDVLEKNKTLNKINELSNNLTIINNNIVAPLNDIQNNKDSILPLLKNMNAFNNKKKYFKESTVKLEFLASYNNINKMADGKYINNKSFQKATKKFIDYYTNSVLKKKENLNENNNDCDSLKSSSYNRFYTESSVKNSSKDIRKKLYSDELIKNTKKQPNITNSKSSQQIKNKFFLNNNVKMENNLKKIKNKFKKKSFKYQNKIGLISDSKEKDYILRHQNSSNISVISDSKHNLNEKEKNSFNNINDNKDIVFLGKNFNSETKLTTNNISNSNYIFGKNLLSKKDKIEKLSEINKKLKEEKIYNSSQNIINNKSNKNINEVNINFTNNFCLIC